MPQVFRVRNVSQFVCIAAGEFVILNQHLMDDLIRLGLWDADMKNELVAANGSVQVSACFDSAGMVPVAFSEVPNC